MRKRSRSTDINALKLKFSKIDKLIFLIPLIVLLICSTLLFLNIQKSYEADNEQFLNQKKYNILFLKNDQNLSDYFNYNYFELNTEALQAKNNIEELFERFLKYIGYKNVSGFKSVILLDKNGKEILKVDSLGIDVDNDEDSNEDYVIKAKSLDQEEVGSEMVSGNSVHFYTPLYYKIGIDKQETFCGVLILKAYTVASKNPPIGYLVFIVVLTAIAIILPLVRAFQLYKKSQEASETNQV